MTSSTRDGVAEDWSRDRDGWSGLAVAGAETDELAHPRARDWRVNYVAAAVIGDALCALLCVAVGYEASAAVPMVGHLRLPNIWVFLASPFVWVLMVAICHGYERRYLGVGTEEYRAIVSAAVRLLAIVVFVSYAFRTDNPSLSRLFVLIFFPGLAFTGLLARFCVRSQLHRARWRGDACHRTVVVGRDFAVRALISDLEREPVHGLMPVALWTAEGRDGDPDLRSGGQVRGIVRTAQSSGADAVVIASPSGIDPVEMRRLSWKLDDLGIELIVSPGVIEVTGPRLSVRPAANLSLLHIERPALRGLSAFSKAAFDRVSAATLLVVASPLLLVVAVVVKLSPKPCGDSESAPD